MSVWTVPRGRGGAAQEAGMSIDKVVREARRKCFLCEKFTTSKDGVCPSCAVEADLKDLLGHE